MLDREQATFKHYPLLPEEGWIRTILEAQDGMLWIGVMGHGLLALDRTTGALKWYQHDSGDPRSLPTDLVKPVYETRDGTLWVGTIEGVSRLDRETETFTTYLEGAMIRTLYEDGKGRLWAGARFRFSWLRTKKYALQQCEASSERGEGSIYFALFRKDAIEINTLRGPIR